MNIYSFLRSVLFLVMFMCVLMGGLVEVIVQVPLESQREHWVPGAETTGSSRPPEGDPGS